MAKLPTVVSNLAPDLRAFVNRVREAIDGKGNDKLVTVDDLIRGGIAVPGPGGTIIPPAGGVTIATPPAPTSLSATGAIQNIIVEWDDPRYFGHAYAEVWGASTDSLGDAVLLGMTPGAIYIDAIGPGSVRYYWVRFVNTLDTAGPYNAVDGTRGETGPDVAYLLEVLTGAITETQLFSSLGARIDNIEVNTTAIQTEATIRSDADSALAEQVTTVQASVDDNTAAIQVEALARVDADNSLFAQYSVKIDTNGYVSGFGLSSTANNATPLSDFIIRADRFSIASPSGPGITPVIPFIVTTTPQTINGVTVPVGVYINGAFIQNGTITNAKIGNAAIDDAKIANLSAGKITAGSISVGSYIQSSNYLIGSQGWKIHGDGTAEFAAASIRGQLTAGQIDTRGLSIKDANGNIILAAGTALSTANISGLGALATQNSVAYSNVSGTKPPFDATRNRVFSQAAEPTVGVAEGDIWQDTSTTQSRLWTYLSGAWRLSSTVGASFNAGFGQITGQITPSNVSTYISSLAVGTLQIGTNAVTVPIGAELSADIQLPQVSDFSGASYSSWATIFEGTADFGGQPLHLDFDYALSITNNNNVVLGKSTVQFLINNTLIASQAEFSGDSFPVFRANSLKRFISNPGSGTLNLKIVAKTDPGMTSSMLSINTSQFFGLFRKGTSVFVLGTKR